MRRDAVETKVTERSWGIRPMKPTRDRAVQMAVLTILCGGLTAPPPEFVLKISAGGRVLPLPRKCPRPIQLRSRAQAIAASTSAAVDANATGRFSTSIV